MIKYCCSVLHAASFAWESRFCLLHASLKWRVNPVSHACSINRHISNKLQRAVGVLCTSLSHSSVYTALAATIFRQALLRSAKWYANTKMPVQCVSASPHLNQKYEHWKWRYIFGSARGFVKQKIKSFHTTWLFIIKYFLREMAIVSAVGLLQSKFNPV